MATCPSYFVFKFIHPHILSLGWDSQLVLYLEDVVAVPPMSSLISSFALSHISTCFGLCSSLGGHVCGSNYERAKL